MEKALWVDDGSGKIRNPELTESEWNEGMWQLVQTNISDLWSAANTYQESQISGAAIGLLTIGVIQNKPISVTVMSWIQSIWELYYQRKAEMVYDPNPSIFDFSTIGQIPYTVPEIRVEVLGS